MPNSKSSGDTFFFVAMNMVEIPISEGLKNLLRSIGLFPQPDSMAQTPSGLLTGMTWLHLYQLSGEASVSLSALCSDRPSPSSYTKLYVTWEDGRQQEGKKDQAKKLLKNRDIKSNPGFVSSPLCFVLGNLTATLDSVKHACPCGKISFLIHQRLLRCFYSWSHSERGAESSARACVFLTYKKK